MEVFIRKIRAKRAYRRLFLDEAGQLRPEALTVLEDLYHHTRLFRDVPGDPVQLAIIEGSRQVVRHILKQVNVVDQEMKRQIKQGVFNADDI